MSERAEPLPQFEPMTLANVGDGELEKQFQDHQAKVTEIFDESSRYEATQDQVKCTVKLEVEISLDTMTGHRTYGVTSTIKEPKRKKVVGALYHPHGVFMVEPDRTQNLFPLPTPDAANSSKE